MAAGTRNMRGSAGPSETRLAPPISLSYLFFLVFFPQACFAVAWFSICQKWSLIAKNIVLKTGSKTAQPREARRFHSLSTASHGVDITVRAVSLLNTIWRMKMHRNKEEGQRETTAQNRFGDG